MALGISSYRPPVMGVTHMVSAGHYLAASAGYRILEQGGNAIDAGVASGIVINVTLPHATNFGGVAPIILYMADTEKVSTISGLGSWPQAASIDHFLKNEGGQIPPGIKRCVVPSAPDAWLTALEKFGTMTFEEVVTPALELAEDGFPVSGKHVNRDHTCSAPPFCRLILGGRNHHRAVCTKGDMRYGPVVFVERQEIPG
ncbi:MAG: gamma-glutamyltransferase [Chloroflexi bacterium]|nr:gamma-glutamyltransferase [Chloroflexota bacterium]